MSSRAAGVLLHPTSLPGPFGIGELGVAAFEFIDFLERAGQTIWQVLPLGPTGYGDSPYAAFSTFAGNPLLIDVRELVALGDLQAADLETVPTFPPIWVDYGWVQSWKLPLLRKAAATFLKAGSKERRERFEAFCVENGSWLPDYALFMAVKEQYDARARKDGVGGAMWNNYWDADIALREPSAMARWTRDAAESIEHNRVLQFYFFEQWRSVRQVANEKGIRIVGDIPIFVAPDSADVWANRALFHLDTSGRPTVVAGVPPDYFSPTGQLWGNPLYDWNEMARRGFEWWLARIRATLRLVDIVRIDHFRGFQAYWEVPAGRKTAEVGKWVEAPGRALFAKVRASLGDLPVMAEDLGLITPPVVALRDEFGFPGMRVLQFGFSRNDNRLDARNQFLPHNFSENSVVYTGTHDNDTTLGWYRSLVPEDQDIIRRYLARDDHDIVWDFIRLAFASVSRYAIVPLQDILARGSEARMNRPSTVGGNWCWRFGAGDVNDWVVSRLREMTELYGRVPD